MDNKPQTRYSVIALIITGVAIVVTLFMGIIKLMMGMEVFTPPNPETYDLILNISAALIVIGLAAYAIIEPERVRAFLMGRQARYGSNALVLLLAFTGIVVVANYLVATNADLLALKWDPTENKVNTLSPEMIQAMQTLPANLTATGFFSQTPADSARQLFEDMRAQSNGKFDYYFVDPVKDPGTAKEAGITGDGKILLEMNGRREIAAYADEAEILTALNRIMNPESFTVYFLTGHGESDINGFDQNALSRASEVLGKKNFTVKTLNLLAENTIPADAKAIVIVGPVKPVSESEARLLNNYALGGGALVVMQNPNPLTDFGDSPDPLADLLASSWGLRRRADFVVDTANPSAYQDAVGALFDPEHPITSTMTQVAILPLTSSIEITAIEGLTQTSLVETTPDSQSPAWGETDFTPLQSANTLPEYTQDIDVLGPLTMVAASENQSGGRVVLVGSSGFATDQYFDIYGNSDLFTNMVAWAAGQGESIDITPKDTTTRTFMPPNQVGAIGIYLSVICLVPGLVLGAGIYSFAARRRRG